MNPHALTADTLSAFAGILLSLVFSYVPKVKDWFEKQPGTTKRLVVLGSLAAIAGGSVALACTAPYVFAIVPGSSTGMVGGGGLFNDVPLCTPTNIVDVLTAFIAALVANQSTYSFAPQPKVVQLPAPDPALTVVRPTTGTPGSSMAIPGSGTGTGTGKVITAPETALGADQEPPNPSP